MSRIFSRLPYVDTASVTRYLPNRVIITVTESEAMAAIGQEGQYWVIDSGGKILMQGTAADAEGLISVRGLTPVSPHRGRDARHPAAPTPARPNISPRYLSRYSCAASPAASRAST